MGPCARSAADSILARLVSRPAFHRADRRPPPAASSSEPRNAGADGLRFGRAPLGLPPAPSTAGALGFGRPSCGLRGRGRAAALRFCLLLGGEGVCGGSEKKIQGHHRKCDRLKKCQKNAFGKALCRGFERLGRSKGC